MKVCPFACDISNDKVGCNHKFWFRIRHALDRMLQASKNLQWIKHQVTGTPTPFSKWHTILDTPINSTIINLNWYTISTFIHHRCAQRKTNDFHLPFGLVSAGARNPDAWYGVAGRRRANEAALANDSFELPNEVNASKSAVNITGLRSICQSRCRGQWRRSRVRVCASFETHCSASAMWEWQ